MRNNKNPVGQIQREQYRQYRNNQSGARVLAALGLMTVGVQLMQTNTFVSAAVQHEVSSGSQHQGADGKMVSGMKQQQQSKGKGGKLINSKGIDVDSNTPVYQNAIAKTLALMKKKASPNLPLASSDSDSTQSLALSETIGSALAADPNLAKATAPTETSDASAVEEINKSATQHIPTTLINEQKYALAQEGSKSSNSEEKASISEVAAALSGNVTEKELSNGKLVDADKVSSMSFVKYSDSQAQALSAKQNQINGKDKTTPTKSNLDSVKRTATSERIYDKALTSRTILPADSDDASPPDQMASLPETPKPMTPLTDSLNTSTSNDIQQTIAVNAFPSLTPPKKNEEPLVAPAFSKKTSLMQGALKESADNSAAAGTDEGLIESLMQQNPSLNRASAAQLAQSLIDKELGTSEPQTPLSAPAQVPVDPSPILPVQQLSQSIAQSAVAAPEPDLSVQTSPKDSVKSEQASFKETFMQDKLSQIIINNQKKGQKEQNKARKQLPTLNSGDQNAESSEPKVLPAPSERDTIAGFNQDPAKMKSLQLTPQVQNVNIVTEKPLDPAQYASQITDSLLQPLQQEIKKDEQPDAKAVIQPVAQPATHPVVHAALTTPISPTKTGALSQKLKIKSMIEKAKIEKQIQSKAKIQRLSGTKVPSNGDTVMSQVIQPQQIIIQDQKATETRKGQEKSEENSSSGDSQLAVQHTLALLKAQKLNKDLVEYNKLLQKKDDTQPNSPTSQHTIHSQTKSQQDKEQLENQQEQDTEQSKKDNLIQSISKTLAQQLKKIQAVAQTNSSNLQTQSTISTNYEIKSVDSSPQSRKLSSSEEAQRVLDEANSISEKAPQTWHLIDRKKDGKTAVKGSALKGKKVEALSTNIQKKDKNKDAESVGSTDADDFASKTAKLLNGDLTMAEQDLRLDQGEVLGMKGKKTFKLNKLKVSSPKSIHIKPIHLISKSGKVDHTSNMLISGKGIPAGSSQGLKHQVVKRAKKEKKLNAGEVVKEVAKEAFGGSDTTTNDSTTPTTPIGTKPGTTNRAGGDCPTGVSCPLGSAALWPGVVGQHSQSRSSKTHQPFLAQSSYQNIIAKTIALAKQKRGSPHGPPKAKMFLQLNTNEQSQLEEKANAKGGNSNQATASISGKSKFIDGWDENKREFTSKKDRKEEGALVIKAAFSMNEVNGGSMGERPGETEIMKTVNTSFASPNTKQSMGNKPKTRTVQKSASSLEQTSDDGGETHHHRMKARDEHSENNSNNAQDSAPGADSNLSSRKPKDHTEEAVRTALEQLNTKTKPFSKDIPKIQQEEGDVLSYSDHLEKSESADHTDSQDSVSELMRAKVSEETKRKPRKKLHQSLHQITQKDAKEPENENEESQHSREADVGDEDKYLERLNIRDGDRQVPQESPLNVYETIDHSDDAEKDGHVESDMERSKEFEKAGVNHYQRKPITHKEDSDLEEKHTLAKHHRAQKRNKQHHEAKEDDEENTDGRKADPGDYSKEVRKVNKDVFDSTEQRNREAISYESHEEPEETHKAKEREEREDKEKKEKDEMKEHEKESKKEKEDDVGDYHKEVVKINKDTFKETEERNNDAISHSHHDESEEYDHEKEKSKKEEQERGEKERKDMQNEKSEEHKEEGYGEEVRKRNTDTFDVTEKRNREVITYTQKTHKHRLEAEADAEVEKSVDDQYKEILERNEDALAEHYRPEQSNDKKKEDSQHSNESKSSLKFKSSAENDEKKKEEEHEQKDDEKKEDKDEESDAKSENKSKSLSKHAKFKDTGKRKEIKADLKEMKKALDTFHKSSKDLKTEVKDEKTEEIPKVDTVESIDHIAKQADSMEKVMEEELKGLTSELRKKEDKEEKEEPISEPVKDEVKQEKKEEAKEEEPKDQDKKEEESKDIIHDAPSNDNEPEKTEDKKAAEKHEQSSIPKPKLLVKKPALKKQSISDKTSDKKARQQEQLYGHKKKADKNEALKDIEDAKDQIRKALKELETSGDEDAIKDTTSKDMETLKQFSKGQTTQDKQESVKLKEKQEKEAKKKADAREKERAEAEEKKKASEKAEAEEKAKQDALDKQKKEAEEKEKEEAEARAAKEKKAKEEAEAEAKAKAEEHRKEELEKKKNEQEAKEKKLHQDQEKAKHDAEEKAKKEKEVVEKAKEKEKQSEKKEEERTYKKPEFAKKEAPQKENEKKEESGSIKLKLEENMKKETELQKKVGQAIDAKLEDEKKTQKTSTESEQTTDDKNLIGKDHSKKEPNPSAPTEAAANTAHHQHHQSKEAAERQKHIHEQLSARLKEEHRPGMIFGIPNVFERAWSGVKWIFGMS